MRRARTLTRADIKAIHDALRAAGQNPDDIGFDDILWLWQQGKTPEQIARAFVQHAARN